MRITRDTIESAFKHHSSAIVPLCLYTTFVNSKCITESVSRLLEEGTNIRLFSDAVLLLTRTSTSGTNGYVVRNMSVLRSHETAAERAAAWDVAPPKHREPDAAILEHEKKRKVEIKCLELQLELEEKGYV